MVDQQIYVTLVIMIYVLILSIYIGEHEKRMFKMLEIMELGHLFGIELLKNMVMKKLVECKLEAINQQVVKLIKANLNQPNIVKRLVRVCGRDGIGIHI